MRTRAHLEVPLSYFAASAAGLLWFIIGILVLALGYQHWASIILAADILFCLAVAAAAAIRRRRARSSDEDDS